MRCNTYRDQMESAAMFGKPVLYTGLQIERESIPEQLNRETTWSRPIKNSFYPHEEQLRLAEFCMENHLDCPQDPRKYVLRPASPSKEAGQFYSQMDSAAVSNGARHENGRNVK